MIKNCVQCGARTAEDGSCLACLLAAGLDVTTMAPEAETAAGADAGPRMEALEEDSFGPYKILRVLGQGGMGIVYLAEQRAPIERRVAIKVIKLGLDTAAVLARFEYERQSVARMDHPNIARVYDAGATAKGRPYFVMEYVDGEPITSYCDRMRMNTRERLRLFQPVCQAVQHAHAKGILHRDIKPSNVMVTVVDGLPEPKMIDFGISKALDQDAVNYTAFTEYGQFVGTPAYMSPEAANVITGDVDATSDVYSLGVLLYELLVGAVPFDDRSLRRAGLIEMLRIIREEEAPVPTKKLTGDTAQAVAECRGTDAATLRRQVSGDLSWIVMKALEKSRERRYGSASDLLADIQLHLADYPVKASPPGLGYRARKFVRRNRGAVLAGAGIFAALAAGVAGTVIQRNEAIRQRIRAEEQARRADALRFEAEREAKRAVAGEKLAAENLEAVRGLAHSMLTELDDEVKPLMGATGARSTLVRLGTQYLDRLPEVSTGAAYGRMGELQTSLWDRAKARENFRKAIAIGEARLRVNPADVEARRRLARNHLSLSRVLDEWVHQMAALEQGEKIARSLATNDSVGLRVLSQVAQLKRRYLEAYELSERAYAVSGKKPEDLGERIDAAIAYGNWLTDGDFQAAERVLGWSIREAEGLVKAWPVNAEYQRLLLEGHLGMATMKINGSKPAEFLEESKRALEIAHRLAAADPRNGRWSVLEARILRAKARADMEMNRMPEATSGYDSAVALLKRRMAEAPGVAEYAMEAAETLRESAWVFRNTRRYQLAIPRNEEAVDILRRLLVRYPERVDIRLAYLRTMLFLGFNLGEGREPARAEKVVLATEEESERLARSSSNAENLQAYALAVNGRAIFLRRQGRASEGLDKLRQSLSIFRDLVIRYPDQVTYREQRVGLMGVLSRQLYERGEVEAAIAVAKEALELAEYGWQRWPKEMNSAKMMFDATFNLRYEYTVLGRYDDAIAISKRAVAMARQSYEYAPEDLRRASRLAGAIDNLAGDYERSGMRREMVETARECAAFIAKEMGQSGWVPSLRAGANSLRVDLARFLRQGLLFGEAAALADTAIREYTEMLRADEENDQLRSGLLQARGVREVTAYEAGDHREKLRQSVEVVKIRETLRGRTPNGPFMLGWRYLTHASHLGGSRSSSGKGIGLLEDVYAKAMERVDRNGKDTGTRMEAVEVAWCLGVLTESRGDLVRARLWYERGLEQARRVVALEPGHARFAVVLQTMEALYARVTGGGTELVKARGDWAYCNRLTDMGFQTPVSAEALARARRLVVQDASLENRFALARLLNHQAHSLFYETGEVAKNEVVAYEREANELMRSLRPGEKWTEDAQGLSVVVRIRLAAFEEMERIRR